MTWEQLYRLKYRLRNSLALWPAVSLIAAIIYAPVMRSFDAGHAWAPLHYSTDGARALLGALTASMLTFIVFVLSSLLIVVQLASAQLTSRIIAFALSRPRIKGTLSLFTFTFTTTLAALARCDAPLPHLHISIAVFLNLICLVAFFWFVQQLAHALRPISLMQQIAMQGVDVIKAVYPQPYDPCRSEESDPSIADASAATTIEHDESSGVVLAVGASRLAKLAASHDAVIEVVPQVGDFIARGDPLLRIVAAKSRPRSEELTSCVAIGAERTLEQDPRFAFRILVDIAIRALSPAINDPTTAVLALDQLHRLMLFLGKRHLDNGRVCDAKGVLRVCYGTPDWPDFVILSLSEIRQYGVGSLQVCRRLRAMLIHLIDNLPEARHPILREELALLTSAVERGFSDEQDRKRAGVGDYQGVGGSDVRQSTTTRRGP